MTDVLKPLKAGSKSQPLFMAHGIGGSANEFVDLVKFVRTKRCIYGLEAKGNNGGEQPFERIEDLARYYLDAIKRVQPRGPYSLIGFSLGGLVALEMAQQISSSGEIVAFLAMMDSYPHPKRLSFWQRTRLASRRIKGRALNAIPFSMGLDPHLKSSARNSAEQIAPGTDMPLDTKQLAYNRAYKAWKHYQPQFYPGKIRFVKADVTTIYPDDPVAVWGKLASELEVRTVPGDHHEILSANYEILGSVLSSYLAETEEGLQ